MPMVQFSLVSLLQLVNEGVLTLERLVALACHHPAQRFSIAERGYLRPGYKADFVMVRPDAQWTLSAADVESKCKWSPLEGRTFDWKVVSTYCNGKAVYKDGAIVSDALMGEAVSFDRA
jgi:dihydroorotase